MVEKCRKFSQTELDPETPQSTKSLNFAKLLIGLFVVKSKVTFYQLAMCVKMKVAQSCPTLWDPVDYTVYGILQARILEWIVIPFSRGSSQPRNWTQVSHSAGRFFTSWATREGPDVRLQYIRMKDTYSIFFLLIPYIYSRWNIHYLLTTFNVKILPLFYFFHNNMLTVMSLC